MSTKHFTPKDIKVGHLYGREDYPNSVWLGVGKREPFTSGATPEFSEKHLVLIASPDFPESVGFMFKTTEDSFGAWQSDWDMFFELGNSPLQSEKNVEQSEK